MSDAVEKFASLPGRLLLDTCILNKLFEEGAYVWEGELPAGTSEAEVNPDLRALQAIISAAGSTGRFRS